MNKVYELEMWSRPGRLLDSDIGKSLKPIIDEALELPEDVFLGLSNIPASSDSKSLAIALSEGELEKSDYRAFCKFHGLSPFIENNESASKFLQFCYGQAIAWLHIPHTEFGLDILRKLQLWAKEHAYNIQDGNRLYCLIHSLEMRPLEW